MVHSGEVMLKTLVPIAGLVAVSTLSSLGASHAKAVDLSVEGTLIGISLPSKVAAVAPEQAGKLVTVPVSDGDRVRAGDVLFKMSSKLEELEVARLRDLADSDVVVRRAEASLQHVIQEETRLRELRNREISSDRDLEALTHEVELAKLRLTQSKMEKAQANNELAQAVERLAQRTVHSPFPGIVTQRFKSEGEAVERFVPVIEVMTLDPLWIEFDCPVADEHWFHVGGEVVVAPAVRPDDKRAAKILHVSMKATASSHTFMVRAAVANEDLRWKSGLKMVIQPPILKDTPSKPGK